MVSKKLIDTYIEDSMDSYFQKKCTILDELTLYKLIEKKNPYLFSMYTIKAAGDIVRELMNAYISSSEETMFGDWLEGLAVFINQKVYSGWKSGIKGIDLEFDKEGIRYIVSIKSGPNWGNSSQIEKQDTIFTTAKKTLRTSNSHMNIVCVNGCCYGKDNNPDKGSYYKYCGQAFWEFIGGNENLYTDIIEPLGHKAKENKNDYTEKYVHLLNRFTKEFIDLFCDDTGMIAWNKLVIFNSGKKL